MDGGARWVVAATGMPCVHEHPVGCRPYSRWSHVGKLYSSWFLGICWRGPHPLKACQRVRPGMEAHRAGLDAVDRRSPASKACTPVSPRLWTTTPAAPPPWTCPGGGSSRRSSAARACVRRPCAGACMCTTSRCFACWRGGGVRQRAQLLFPDTDSLAFKVRRKDVYSELLGHWGVPLT